MSLKRPLLTFAFGMGTCSSPLLWAPPNEPIDPAFQGIDLNAPDKMVALLQDYFTYFSLDSRGTRNRMSFLEFMDRYGKASAQVLAVLMRSRDFQDPKLARDLRSEGLAALALAPRGHASEGSFDVGLRQVISSLVPEGDTSQLQLFPQTQIAGRKPNEYYLEISDLLESTGSRLGQLLSRWYELSHNQSQRSQDFEAKLREWQLYPRDRDLSRTREALPLPVPDLKVEDRLQDVLRFWAAIGNTAAEASEESARAAASGRASSGLNSEDYRRIGDIWMSQLGKVLGRDVADSFPGDSKFFYYQDLLQAFDALKAQKNSPEPYARTIAQRLPSREDFIRQIESALNSKPEARSMFRLVLEIEDYMRAPKAPKTDGPGSKGGGCRGELN